MGVPELVLNSKISEAGRPTGDTSRDLSNRRTGRDASSCAVLSVYARPISKSHQPASTWSGYRVDSSARVLARSPGARPFASVLFNLPDIVARDSWSGAEASVQRHHAPATYASSDQIITGTTRPRRRETRRHEEFESREGRSSMEAIRC